MRDDRWKLVAYPSLHYRQLFDLENDPLETRNLREPPAIDLSGERRTPDRWQPAWIVEKYFDMPAGPPAV